VSAILDAPQVAEPQNSALRHFVWMLLSRFIGTAGGQRNVCYELSSILAYMASLPFVEDDGTLAGPIAPELEVVPSNGPTVMRRNGWNPADRPLVGRSGGNRSPPRAASARRRRGVHPRAAMACH
jgi:hypothetical protein